MRNFINYWKVVICDIIYFLFIIGNICDLGHPITLFPILVFEDHCGDDSHSNYSMFVIKTTIDEQCMALKPC